MTDDPLWEAIQAARARWSPHTLARFPSKPKWEPSAKGLGTGKADTDQQARASVPTVPTVPIKWGYGTQRTQPITDDQLAAWEERAAVLEFDGGMSRPEAERNAALELGLATVLGTLTSRDRDDV